MHVNEVWETELCPCRSCWLLHLPSVSQSNWNMQMLLWALSLPIYRLWCSLHDHRESHAFSLRLMPCSRERFLQEEQLQVRRSANGNGVTTCSGFHVHQKVQETQQKHYIKATPAFQPNTLHLSLFLLCHHSLIEWKALWSIRCSLPFACMRVA